MMRLFRPGSIWLSVLVATVGYLGALHAPVALATTPALSVQIIDDPTNFPPGGEGKLVLRVFNLGDAPAVGSASPIVIADKLPTGLKATAITGNGLSVGGASQCKLATLRCEFRGTLDPYVVLQIEIAVKVEPDPPSTMLDEASVSGAGSAGATARQSVKVSNKRATFGVEELKLVPTNEDGTVDTQAGSHPFELTTTLQLAGALEPNPLLPSEPEEDEPAGSLPKDFHFNLPAGLIGNPQVVPQCTSEQFDELLEFDFNGCPADTALGVAEVEVNLYAGSPLTVPLFNLVPAVGEPARFGFSLFHVPIILNTAVRTGGDYGVVVSVNNISQVFGVLGSQVTFWGVPEDPRHNPVRGWNCLFDDEHDAEYLPCVAPVNPRITPFLTLPTSCSGPAGMRSTVEADSWGEPGVFKQGEYSPVSGAGEALGLVGCNRLPFGPSIGVAPDGASASTPTGLTVGVHVSQAGVLTPTGLAPSDLKNTTVTLPAGVQISPAGADGLMSCSLAQVGLEIDASPTCPEAAKVGTAEVKTPLLPEPLEGAVYLAAQNANPFGSLLALYIVVEDPTAGVVIKFAGKTSLDPVTGQLVSTFENTPALPFEELKLHFFGSARAPLSTPPLCGSYTTQAQFAPWSGNPPTEASSTFQITSGPNGAPCADPQPFTPGFEAGSSNLQAGAFTPFALTMSRPDADQTLSRVELHMPPGLLGTLSKVKLCPEPQAQQGTCGEESLIGHTIVSAGLGNDPYTVTGGKVFVTGPYKGAPYGLSILNPAKAGPFDLGSVVVRAQIRVDPHTAALTIVSDPLPTIIDGIPLQIQHVQVAVERPGGFTFNATSCEPMQITGTLTSTEGASANESSHYQVTNCGALAFKPKLTASTSGKTSRLNGASLGVKLSYPAGPFDANIAKVKVELPKVLPSRLKTLQKACLARVFAANPAACPATSIVGHAKAVTPVLPVSLEGPAYFVSNGGEAFPNLVVVLQGYGTTVDLVGSTFISEGGITSSTFKTVPDVPVGTFELNLPEGPYSALATSKNLCKTKLVMPTEFVGQNGAALHEETPIGVTGCAKALTRAQKLAAALKACRQKRRHVKKCKKAADAKYGRRGKKATRK